MNPANKWLLGYVSATLVTSATLWEGTKYYAYKDIGGIPTVCSGYTGSGIIFGKKYSKEECGNFTRTELVTHGKGILNCINVPIREHEYNAYTLFAYNVGVSAACGSRAIRLLNAGDHTAACNALVKGPNGELVWVYVKGQYVKGLHNRRNYEREMCLDTEGLYAEQVQIINIGDSNSRPLGPSFVG